MQWLVENWPIVLFGVGMVAIHLFGHGKYGNKFVLIPRPVNVNSPEADLDA